MHVYINAMRATFYVYVKEDEQIKREIECDSYYKYRGMLLEREGKFSLVHHETTFTDERADECAEELSHCMSVQKYPQHMCSAAIE